MDILTTEIPVQIWIILSIIIIIIVIKKRIPVQIWIILGVIIIMIVIGMVIKKKTRYRYTKSDSFRLFTFSYS